MLHFDPTAKAGQTQRPMCTHLLTTSRPRKIEENTEIWRK